MKKRILKGHKCPKSTIMLFPGILLLLLLLIPGQVMAVNYHIYGQVTNVYNCTEEELEDDPTSPCDVARPIPAPIVEVWDANTSVLLGKIQSTSLYGYYHVIYAAPATPAHTVYFRVLQMVEGKSELIGEVHKKNDGTPIVVTSTNFPFSMEVDSDNMIRFSDVPAFSTTGEFMFIEVGNIDMDDIYDKEQDPTFSTKWGLTKDSDPKTLPDTAFGSNLELYGLFGDSSVDNSYYYKIRYESIEGDSGYIQDILKKKNYKIVGTDIIVDNVTLGPVDVITTAGPLNGVYRMDERLSYEPGYSTYWTEVGLRAIWKTGSKNGNYTLSVERWDKNGNLVPASTNNYATLNLRLVNTAPVCTIHKIQYLDGTDILSGPSTECVTAYLNLTDGYSDNDNLQFLYTAKHTEGFMGTYWFYVSHGHSTGDGYVFNNSYSATTPPFFSGADNQTAVTPATITYKSCAYRFQLHVYPRITDGYDPHIYEREDNWYVCVKVIE